mgnify:CR=1 FL=1
MKKKLLFLCTGNSCRSQIAEGFGKEYLIEYNISSAGAESHGINPHAIKIMYDIGIDISCQFSKKIDLNNLNNYDVIITLCGDVKDKCPTFKNNVKHIHWDLENPANITGNNEKILNGFADIRDKILMNIKLLKQTIKT